MNNSAQYVYGSLTDAIADFKAGKFIWSISMGGFGPGYEQAIQVTTLTMIDALLAGEPIDWRNDAQINARMDMAMKHSHLYSRLSGSQGAAAIALATVFMRDGYTESLAAVKEDRRIQIEPMWPADRLLANGRTA